MDYPAGEWDFSESGLSLHCQDFDNTHCCAPGYEWCPGEGCVSIDLGCCPPGEYHCPTQDDECRKEGQCCPEGEYWCEADESCLPIGTPCCDYDTEEWCQYDGECHDIDEHCCPPPTEWCDPEDYAVIPTTPRNNATTGPDGRCREHCCDEALGEFWCETFERCLPEEECCDTIEEYYCEYQKECIPDDQACCPDDYIECAAWEYNNSTIPGCAEHCCQPPDAWWLGKCTPPEDQCPDGETKCRYDYGDDECYTPKECCELAGDIWCHDQCLPNEAACCEATEDEDGNHYEYIDGECCPPGYDNYNDYENGGPRAGCCHDVLPGGGSDCCRDPADTWDQFEHKCVPPCPCEGCCDFNCCDELDFFMHKAYDQYYSEDYPSFAHYYAAWYTDFYAWWTGASH